MIGIIMGWGGVVSPKASAAMVGKRMISFRYGTSGEIKEVIIIIIIVGIIIVGIIIIQVCCRFGVGMLLVCTP